MSVPMARKCERLDIAVHYAMHTTEAKGEEFIRGMITVEALVTGLIEPFGNQLWFHLGLVGFSLAF